MDGYTLTASSDIFAAARLAGLAGRMRQMWHRGGCGKWDTWVYRGANRTESGREPDSIELPVTRPEPIPVIVGGNYPYQGRFGPR